MQFAGRPDGTDRDVARHKRRSRLIAVAVVVSLGLVFELDAATGEAPFQHLYYAPIVLAALALPRFAGPIAACAAIVLYHLANPVLLAGRYREPDIVQIALFLGIGIVTAKLTDDRRHLRRLSMTDDLTKLYNLRGFEDRLAKALRTMSTENRPLSMLVLDVDKLKSLNDTHGHVAGADAVRTVGRVIGAQLPPDAFACRFGGDEFVIALPARGLEEAHATAEALRQAVQSVAPKLAGIPFPPATLSISIGLACQQRFDGAGSNASSAHAASGESLFRAADQALYVAKSGGRNRISAAVSEPASTTMEGRADRAAALRGDGPAAVPRLRWLPWVLGSALLAAVVAAASQLAQEREFARLLESARPGWLIVAVALQAATYLAQAEVFRAAIPRDAHASLRRTWLYELSLAKLFLDQALPSAGVSSTVVIVKALESRRVPRGAAAACAMINIASYHAAYAVALLVALAITVMLRETSWILVSTSVAFIAFATAMTAGIPLLAGRRAKPGAIVMRVPGIKSALKFLQDSDGALVRERRILGTASAWQLAIILLDAATMSMCIRAIGAHAPTDAVFASFMIASLVRTMGVVPGGLGTYEATSIATLHLIGISVSAALSATLIFRGLSFWIPMLPGLWSSRRILRPRETIA